MLAKAKIALSITFIVLASFTIVTYDHQNMFIIQATGVVFTNHNTPSPFQLANGPNKLECLSLAGFSGLV